MAFKAIALTLITAYDKICNKVPSKFLKELHNESKEVSMKPKKKPIYRLHLSTSPQARNCISNVIFVAFVVFSEFS